VTDDLSRALEDAHRLAEAEDWEGMAELLRTQLRHHPDDPSVLCWLGVAEREMGLSGVAYERFRACLAAGAEDPLVMATAGAGLAAFDDPDAEGALRTAALLAPDLAYARLMYGAYLAREGLFEDALRELQAARDLEPDDPEVLYEVGIGLALAGERDRAVEALAQAAELDLDNGPVHTLLGLALLDQERVDEALPALIGGARASTDDLDSQLIAALASAAEGDDGLAWEMLERARLLATASDVEVLEDVEDRLDDADGARAFLLEDLAPLVYRQRLSERP
jgi:tetratricopeptide (TPR) repeat protein